MEPEMAVRGINFLKDNLDIEVNEIINDWDSRSYYAILGFNKLVL